MKNKIMIIAGEASGDLHGSRLVAEMHKIQPDLALVGIGGDKMQQQGVQLLYHINQMSVMGFWDVIKQFRFFKKVYQHCLATMDQIQPQLLILIDYPGLNLKLARAARQRKIPVLYYIAPQVWAWGSNRIQKMVHLVDKMAVIIPFEEQLFQQAGIDARFVGHPLLEAVQTRVDRDSFYRQQGLDMGQKTIGLLPGSRNLEVKRLLPEMLATIRQLKKRHPHIQALVGQAASVDPAIYQQILNRDPQARLLENSTYEIMKHSDLLIVASGTATLESALFETPLIIVYKVDPISYFIGKQLVTIDSIGLVNVIAEQKIVPEFIQGQFRWDRLVPTIESLLFDEQRRTAMIKELQKIKQKLGTGGASSRTAQIALELLNSKASA